MENVVDQLFRAAYQLPVQRFHQITPTDIHNDLYNYLNTNHNRNDPNPFQEQLEHSSGHGHAQTQTPPPHSPVTSSDNFEDDKEHQVFNEEPVYINAKQYYRILKRRVARARVEELDRQSRRQKPYFRESRINPATRHASEESEAKNPALETQNSASGSPFKEPWPIALPVEESLRPEGTAPPDDDLPDIDISSRLAWFDEQIDASLMGGFGIIRRGSLADGTMVAIKTLKLHHMGLVDIKHSKRFKREVRVWRRLWHPNVLPFLGTLEVAKRALPMSLVSPWMKNGNSFEFCSKRPDVLRMPIIRGIAEGVAHLHSQSVVHGDIKAANVLISDYGVPLLCDFGLAYVCDSAEDRMVSNTVRKAGSLRHMAIELHESESPGLSVTRESDMWALGMLCIELLTGCVPFHGQSEGMVVVRILQGNLPERPDSFECQNRHWDFIQRCWRTDPRLRPTATEATVELRYRFLVSLID